MMKTDNQKPLPHLFMEGIRNIAICGFEHIYEEIIEEYGEKLKQDFMAQMKEKMKLQTKIVVQQALDPVLNELTVKVEIDVKGVEWK